MIGIISDTHDNVINVQKAVKIFIDKGCDLVIHCGDIVAPATVNFFKGINGKFVKGNCDGDVELIKKRVAEIKGEFCGEVCKFEWNNKKIAVYHGNVEEKLRKLIESQKYDYIFTGHTHQSKDEKIGRARIINPGAHYYGCENKIAVLDETNDKLEFIEVK